MAATDHAAQCGWQVGHSRGCITFVVVSRKARDRRDEAIALALYARNVLVAELTIAQGLAQRRQMDAKTALLDRDVRPCPRDQLGLPDNRTGVFEKRNQDVIGPAANWNDLVRLPEGTLGDIELEWAKPKPDRAGWANLLNRHELFRQDPRRFGRCAVRRRSCANTLPADQVLAETSSSNKRQCNALMALSDRYEPFKTCLANRRSEVSRPSRNFVWMACRVRHAASFRPSDFSAMARLVAALSAHDKLACLSASSSALRKYGLPTASPSPLQRASSPLI